MGFLKVKMGIRKLWKAAFIFMAAGLPVCGCGAEKVTYCVDTAQESQAAGSVKQAAVKAAGTDIEETENINDESQLYKNVPVYGKDEKKKIKKYLSSLPDKINEKEAKKKGIIIQSYNENGNKFNTMWQGFYKYVMEGEEALKPEDGVIKCYAKPFRAAIVLLRYTTEGDACYTYISFIEDKYYIMEDNSRDKLRKCIGDGFYEAGTFKSLRKRKEITRDRKKKYCNIIYSVFKKEGISKKEIKKVIKNPDSYADKYYDLFSYYTTDI